MDFYEIFNYNLCASIVIECLQGTRLEGTRLEGTRLEGTRLEDKHTIKFDFYYKHYIH